MAIDFNEELQKETDRLNEIEQQVKQDSNGKAADDPSVPPLGAQSASAFREMSRAVAAALNEIAATQINTIKNLREQSKAHLQQVCELCDKAFDEMEQAATEHKERLGIIGSSVIDKAEDQAQELINMSKRLAKLSSTILASHDELFNHKEEK